MKSESRGRRTGRCGILLAGRSGVAIIDGMQWVDSIRSVQTETPQARYTTLSLTAKGRKEARTLESSTTMSTMSAIRSLFEAFSLCTVKRGGRSALPKSLPAIYHGAASSAAGTPPPLIGALLTAPPSSGLDKLVRFEWYSDKDEFRIQQEDSRNEDNLVPGISLSGWSTGRGCERIVGIGLPVHLAVVLADVLVLEGSRGGEVDGRWKGSSSAPIAKFLH